MSKEMERLLELALPKYDLDAAEHESVIATAALAALVVRPTVTAGISLWNPADPGGKDIVPDRLFTFNLVSAAAQSFFSLWACIHLVSTKMTNEISALRGTGDGREPNQGSPMVEIEATILDDGWFPVGPSGETEEVGVLPGGVIEWDNIMPNGNPRLIVPPQHAISLHVVSSVVTDTFTSGLSYWNTMRRKLQYQN